MGASRLLAPVKLLWAFLIGALIGAGAMALAPRWHPDAGTQAKLDSARVLRAAATAQAATAQAAVDTLNAWRPIVRAALERPRHVTAGSTTTTVIIGPAAPADTARTVTVPPEVVDQLVQDAADLATARDGWARAEAAVGRLTAAARADSLADQAAVAANLAVVADLNRQLIAAQRAARWWKLAGKGALVVGGAALIVRGVSALTR